MEPSSSSSLSLSSQLADDKTTRVKCLSHLELDPESTVEEFLTCQRDKLVGEMETLTGLVLSELTEEYAKASASLREEFASQKAEGYAVELKATGGPHAGATFRLRVAGEPCFLGRSSGKKFKSNGVSLPKDGEVSTTHAKLVVQNGRLVVVDVGSTNGTSLDGADLDEYVPAPLQKKTGSTLVLGSSVLKVTAIKPLAVGGGMVDDHDHDDDNDKAVAV